MAKPSLSERCASARNNYAIRKEVVYDAYRKP
jgi:hypothetical protein